MFRQRRCRFSVYLIALSAICLATEAQAATACVWKVTRPDGKTVYLGGSVHSLRESDYPLPAAYMRAFDASSRIAFEVDAKALKESSKSLVQNGKYRPGDSLKNHVDARTYAYMRRLFELMNVPEASFSQYRPWFIVLMLQSAAMQPFFAEGRRGRILYEARGEALDARGGSGECPGACAGLFRTD